MTLNEVVARFQGAKRLHDTSYQCRCPCHNDKKQSLTITEKMGKILLYCHAGCETADILEAVGLSFSNLGNEDKPAPTWRDRVEFTTQKKIEAVYHYKDEKGAYQYSKIRLTGKDIRYITINEKADTYAWGKPKGSKPTLYGIHRSMRTIKKGFPVYITEGEKDADNLQKLGLTAVTAGGVSDWRTQYALLFIGASVVILPDNDEPGRKLAKEIQKDLRPYAFSVKVVLTARRDKGDVTDYLEQEGGTLEGLNALVAEQKAIYAPWAILSERGLKINAGILASCISEHRIYKLLGDDFYIYDNGVYRYQPKNTIKAMISQYMPKAVRTDSLLNNVYNLLLADTSHNARREEFNTNEEYVNFENGLYNIHTGKLEEHRSDILFSRQVHGKYEEEAKSLGFFDKYINDLCADSSGGINMQKKQALAEWLGLAISNISGYRLKKILILYSPIGNTGKTQFLNIMTHLVGVENIANIPLQNMNEDKGRFALGGIDLIRAIVNGDQSKAEIKDTAILKSLSGGDYLKTEKKGRDIVALLFRGLICIGCNDLPYISDDKGEHLYNRFYLIPCLNVIAEDKRDNFLFEKMLLDIPYIIRFALEGLKRLIQNNYAFTPIEQSLEYIEDYRKESDTVYSFIAESGYVLTKNPEHKISKSALYNQYLNYCMREERQSVLKKSFTQRMEKLTGFKVVRTFYNNNRDYYYQGIALDGSFTKADIVTRAIFS